MPSSPATSFARDLSSAAIRARDCSSAQSASSRGTATTPSSSAQITSPGEITIPPSTTGTLTDPAVALTVPWHETWRDHTGKPSWRSSAVSRTPASTTSARTPRAITEVASSSPNMPCEDGAVLVTTRTSPSSHTSTAAWIIRLSPGWLDTVTAVPATRTPCWIGRMSAPTNPRRPIASWTVAVPASPSEATTARSGRETLRTTTCRCTTTATSQMLAPPDDTFRRVIIDCHGHYTTAPPQLGEYRDRQRADVVADPEHVGDKGALGISDDEIRASLEDAQLRLQRERGTDLTLFSPRASWMGHHLGNIHTSRFWAEHCNELIRRVCDLYPDNFAPVCQLPPSPSAPLKPGVSELQRCVEEMCFVGCNVNPDPSGGAWTGPPLTDSYWDPLYEKLVELDVPAMIHVSAACHPNFHTTTSHYLG